jgi:hypothetical protein
MARPLPWGDVMPRPSSVQRTLLAEEALRAVVLTYLAEHSGAMDTFDGIAEWWITRQQVRVDVERLAYVLGRLTAEGVLEVVGDGAQRLYKLSEGYAWSDDPTSDDATSADTLSDEELAS